MTPFEVQKVKDQLDSEIGITYYLNKSLDEVAAKNAITGTTGGMLLEGVRCILVGYDEEAVALLTKATEWLRVAVSTKERPRIYFRGGTEAINYGNLAIGSWLSNATHDQINLEHAIHWQNVWYAENGVDRVNLSMSLPLYVDAGEFEQTIRLFEDTFGSRAPSKRIKSEGAMAYAIARARLDDACSNPELDQIVDSFLRHQIPRFLDDGDYLAAARWSKVAFWNDRQTQSSPFETVRKCLEYVPTGSRR